MSVRLEVDIAKQSLLLLHNDKLIKAYRVSTAKNGVGELKGSEKTPRGWHIIRAKIGANMALNTVFVGRRPTGELYHHALRARYPNRDWILTRILWLSGLELGRNRLGEVDTMRRYIYIHGTPHDEELGIPGSKGCIRMANQDIIELFEYTLHGTKIYIKG